MSKLQTTGSHNVVVFGETGVGKSSVINMLLGKDEAKVSNAAVGCTFESTAFHANIEGIEFKLHDTAGLNEWEGGKVSAKNAIKNLHQLIGNLGDDGVSLLVYCIRGPRIKENAVNNYRMFYNAFCRREVPIVVIVTGLENEDSMDGWWTENERTLSQYGMTFEGHACITAIKGKRGVFEQEYQESIERVKKLIMTYRLGEPWKMKKGWLRLVLEEMWQLFKKAFDLSYREAASLASQMDATSNIPVEPSTSDGQPTVETSKAVTVVQNEPRPLTCGRDVNRHNVPPQIVPRIATAVGEGNKHAGEYPNHGVTADKPTAQDPGTVITPPEGPTTSTSTERPQASAVITAVGDQRESDKFSDNSVLGAEKPTADKSDECQDAAAAPVKNELEIVQEPPKQPMDNRALSTEKTLTTSADDLDSVGKQSGSNEFP